jgi:hypothetical protein
LPPSRGRTSFGLADLRLAPGSGIGCGAAAADRPGEFTRYDAAIPVIEISVAGITIRVGAEIGEEQLRRVIRAVRSA